MLHSTFTDDGYELTVTHSNGSKVTVWSAAGYDKVQGHDRDVYMPSQYASGLVVVAMVGGIGIYASFDAYQDGENYAYIG